MLRALILFSVATAALAGTFKTPLELYPTGGKIVGGSPAAENEIPWQVSIQSTRSSVYCGGSIISNTWILTAGHCSGINPSNYQIRVGTLTYASGGSVHTINQVIRHEDYGGLLIVNDIAVWSVNEPFVFSPAVAAGVLPAQDQDTAAGTVVWVSGWGTTSSGGQISDILLKVDVPVTTDAYCEAAYSNFRPGEICAGLDEGGKDSCQGDSGGPLYLNGVILGIVSYGNGCASPGFPGVYTEVSYFRDWITTNSGV
ncbi:hypothetical protein B566_EDAN000694 [Ephemera danica]|nr:hypothetical protein B566_EDAN000694 [Ephemera danica]